jgi:hypothetical protein
MTTAILLFSVAALYVVSTLHAIATVGRPRAPRTPAEAAIATVLNAGFIALFIVAGLHFIR